MSLLRYYTSHGTKAYCDGKEPSAADTGWRELYLKMGADQNNLGAR